MNKFWLKILGIFLLLTNYVYSQSFNLYSIDTSGFPNMKAMFYARTPMGVDYPDIVPSDFNFFENGVNLNATLGVDCKKVNFFPQLAVVLVLDVSTSMNDDAGNGERRLDWVKQGAFAFLDSIKLDPPSVIGYVLFSGDVIKTSPLYDSKAPLYDWLNINLQVTGGTTDFYPPFVKGWPPLGALPLLETSPKDLRRVVIFLTDGQPERPFPDWKRDTIISYAKRVKAQVYSIFITMPLYSQVDLICQATGGKSFSVYTKPQLINAFRQIVGDIQSRNVCYLTWVSPFGCDELSRNRNIKAVFKRIPDSVVTSYFAPEKSVSKLEFSDTLLLFGSPGIGTTNRQLSIKAKNSDFVINSFNLSTTNKFSVDWKGKTPPFTLLKDQSHTIEITYTETPVGASSETNFQINATPCQPPSLKLVAPCGGDVVSKIDFGKVPIINTRNQIENCIFRNTTAIPLTFTLNLEGVNSTEFAILNGSGPFTLNPNECLDITIQFKPQTVGNKSARLKFLIPNFCGEFFTNLVGEGIPSDLPIPPIDFGTKRILTINDSVVTIRNSSPSPIEIQNVELSNKSDVNFFITPPANLPLTVPANGTFDLNIHFSPQSEGFLENQVLITIKEFPVSAGVQVFGFGGLPKIEVPDVDCGKAKVGNTVSGQMIIKNTSHTMDLYVSEVLLSPSTEFKFGAGAKTTNIIVSKDGGTFSIPIEFTPSNPGTRRVWAIVKSDAVPGPNKNPLVNDTVIVHGIGEGLLINPDPIDFGEISACGNKEITVEIDNSPFAADLQIGSVIVTGQDATNFQVITYPNSIKAGEKGFAIVKFVPSFGKTSFFATIEFTSNFGERKVPLKAIVVTENISVDYKLDQSKLKVTKELQLPFEVKISRNHLISIGQINFEVKLPKKNFVFKNFTSKLVGWNWDITPTIDGYIINGEGTKFSTPSQFQCTLFFETYLSDLSKPEIKIKPIFPEAQNCLIPIEKSQFINLLTCFTEGRLVEVSEKNYQLYDIKPNPVLNDLAIDFQIAFDDYVSVNIYNSYGERILDLVNSNLKAGSYTFSVSSSHLTNGIYFVHLQTNSYSSVKSFVVLK